MKISFFLTRQKLVKTNKYEVQRLAREQSLHYIHCSTNKRFPSNRIASLMMRGKKACFMHTKSYYGWLNAKYANGKFLSKSLACCYCHARFILKVLWIWHFPTLINNILGMIIIILLGYIRQKKDSSFSKQTWQTPHMIWIAIWITSLKTLF